MSETLCLVDALAKAQSEMKNPASNCSANMHGREYKYPGLNNVVSEIRDACGKHGIFFSQPVLTIDDQEFLFTRVSKGSEEITLGQMPLPKSSTSQAKGADLTYLKRQQATSAFGLAGEDDIDGSGEAYTTPKPKNTGNNKDKNTKASVWQTKLGEKMREAKGKGIESKTLRADLEAIIGRKITDFNDYECEKSIEVIDGMLKDQEAEAGAAGIANDDSGSASRLYEEDVPF